MKRTTVMLPDDLAYLLEFERRRRDQSTAEIVRRALEAYLSAGGMRPKRLRFAALGASGQRETGRQAEAIVTREWESQKHSGSSLRRR
jgi:metal-responsive CopG/Arc/MetJ family transcriptional regulator